MATATGNSDGKAAGSRPATGLDPASLMRIKSLELRAKVVVEGFLNGLHRSPFHGFSVEFSEYRQYSPGDDPRYLDWRLYARSDRYYIKRFEDETNLRCHLLVNLSRSMGFGTLGYDKADYARTAAATLAYFLASQRDAVGLLTFHEQIGEYLPSRYRPGHLHRLMISLEQAVEGADTDIMSPLEQTARIVNKRGLIVLLSDLLAPTEALERNLGFLRSRGHDVIVMRILDPAERDFSFSDAALFHDLETGRDRYIDPTVARKEYLEKFSEHESSIEQACSNLGIEFVPMTIDRPLDRVLFDFMSARMRRGKGRSVASNPSGGGKA